uniref:Uncharacterized protein n=1 Tax=Arion vulgaris TaxID=1028688 RepID=A0A0B7BA44_9EUPU
MTAQFTTTYKQKYNKNGNNTLSLATRRMAKCSSTEMFSDANVQCSNSTKIPKFIVWENKTNDLHTNVVTASGKQVLMLRPIQSPSNTLRNGNKMM